MIPGAKLPAPGSASAWLLAARPKTLAASAAPVMVGSALAWLDGGFRLWPALAALAGALWIQVGTILANDAAVFARGADPDDRLGPPRADHAGLLPPRAVAMGAGLSFAAAAVCGAYLVAVAGAPILILGLVSIAAGVLYTSGPFPLAYRGLGDLFVIAFFGVAAVVGTYYVQVGGVTPAGLGLGLAVGCLADALLMVNNLRDLATDAAAGKRTMAVRLGPSAARRSILALVALAFALPVTLVAGGTLPASALLSLAALPVAATPVSLVRGGAEGRALNAALGAVAKLQMAYATLLAAGLLAGRTG
jgi:1,4-dihydroxy-2-naphthoate octaprenyltransferase